MEQCNKIEREEKKTHTQTEKRKKERKVLRPL